METNYKRQTVIYICFIIAIIITLLILPLYSFGLLESTKEIYSKYDFSIKIIKQFFILTIIVLIISMIIVSIFI